MRKHWIEEGTGSQPTTHIYKKQDTESRPESELHSPLTIHLMRFYSTRRTKTTFKALFKTPTDSSFIS